MRLTVTTFVSLDGVVQGPGGANEDTTGGFAQGGWLVPYADEGMGEFMDEVFAAADAFLLGRRTYQIFEAHWPKVTDENDPVATKLNTLPKYVASTTLTEVGWHNSTLVTDVPAEVAQLKKEPGNELQVHGSGSLVRAPMQHRLVDEFRLLVFPVVLGGGKRLFEPGSEPAGLRLVDSKTMSKGTILAIYRVTGRPTYGTFEMEEGYGLDG